MRLIDANALRNVFDAMHAIEGGSRFAHLVLLGIKKHIDDAPTVDAVPVVRCRECRHSLPSSYSEGLMHCCYTRKQTMPSGFCHMGKRREDADCDQDTV